MVFGVQEKWQDPPSLIPRRFSGQGPELHRFCSRTGGLAVLPLLPSWGRRNEPAWEATGSGAGEGWGVFVVLLSRTSGSKGSPRWRTPSHYLL